MRGFSRFSIVLSLFAGLPVMGAHGLSVDCSGATPGAFTSIGAAIASVPTVSNQTILVKGTCVERVALMDVKNVQIEGSPSATLLHDGHPTDFPIVRLSRAEQVWIRNLTIGAAPSTSAPYTPVQLNDTQLEISGCTISGGSALASGGVWVQGRSRVTIRSSTIQDSSPSGIRIDSGQVSIGESSIPSTPTIIQRNTAGIRLSGNSQVTLWGNTVIRQNGSGVISNGAHVFLCCTPGLQVTGNTSTGIAINLGGTLQANSVATFENNGFAGVRLLSGSAILNTGQIFRGNGQAGNSSSGAIVATGNSHIELFNAEITDNQAHGLLLEEGSTARLLNNTIRNNKGNGVRVIAMSAARLYAPHDVTGNAGDLFCAPNSFARGDDTGFGKSFCPGFDRSPEPVNH